MKHKNKCTSEKGMCVCHNFTLEGLIFVPCESCRGLAYDKKKCGKLLFDEFSTSALEKFKKPVMLKEGEL